MPKANLLTALIFGALLLGALSFASAGSWLGFRQARRHRSALLVLGIGVGIAIAGNPLLGAGAGLDFAASWVRDLPWYDDRRPIELHLLVAALLLFLAATGNAVVRSVLLLATSEDSLKESQSRLRGGRFIGVLERWLIFGLALAGEPTAAALVISAKSIIRFPELSARSQAGASAPPTSPSETSTERPGNPGRIAGREDGPDEATKAAEPTSLNEADEITEYFLLGSLASWTLALAPAALVIAIAGGG